LELDLMKGMIKMIKEKAEVEDDVYNSELKPKLDEIEKVLKKYDECDPGQALLIQYGAQGNSDEERIKEIKKLKDDAGSLKLEKVKEAFEKIAEIVNLEDKQIASLKAIEEEIKNPTPDEVPPSTLKIDELVSVLKGTAELKEDDVKTLTKWQETKNFREKDKIVELVKKYKPGSTETNQKIDGFKEHLTHEDWGNADKRGGKKISKDNYWEDFVKMDPDFIIGAIRHYEYENDLGIYSNSDKKKEVETKMEEANKYESSDKKKKANENNKWDKDKPFHVAKFLYLLAEDKSGEALVRDLVNVESEENGNGNGKSKSWWSFSSDNIARPLATYTGIVLGVVIIVGAIFWKQISAWWSGPAEEEGQGAEESDEKEE